jgi:hypothetical protein
VPSKFCAAKLRRSPSFIRLTGVSVETFDGMLAQLQAPWQALGEAKDKAGRPLGVGGLEDHLLAMLVYFRCYLTQEFVGYFYGVDKSTICRAIKRAESIVTPLFAVRRDPKLSRAEAEAVIIDCTEQPVQRPRDDATQKEHYSGKKKRHTLKTEYIVTEKGRIAAISDSHPGSRHDLTIRRKGPVLPDEARIYADSAYQGYDKEHPNIDVPYKKPQGGGLDDEQKDYNRGLGSFRVGVEHCIGRCKRFRIVSDRYRNPRRTHHTKTAIIAGLVNIEAGFAPF